MKAEIQPHQVRVVSEYFSLDKKFRDLQKFVEENPLFAKLPGEESHLLKQQHEAMSSYRAVLHSRLALWGLKPSEELLWGPDLGRKPEHDPVAFYKSYKASPECKAADEYKAEIARDLGMTFAESVAVTDEQRGCVSPKDAIIRRTKELRVAIDAVLQDVKAFGKDFLTSQCIDAPHADGFEFFADPQEVPANVKLFQRALEDATMRLGMTLKAIGATNPYPESYNPDSTRIEPTADTYTTK